MGTGSRYAEEWFPQCGRTKSSRRRAKDVAQGVLEWFPPCGRVVPAMRENQKHPKESKRRGAGSIGVSRRGHQGEETDQRGQNEVLMGV